MRIVIIGAVAAGTSAAAKARRNSEDAEIVIYEKDGYISYSGCGMPYYIGGIRAKRGGADPARPRVFQKQIQRGNLDPARGARHRSGRKAA